ncbi:T9SS type A sorting domain-containing protein, partial [Flavobacteriales bacterium]|nr:T9SS type A sorting domain-containing protein [Flavobacteriales bacterium]
INTQSSNINLYNAKVLQSVGQLSPIGNYFSYKTSVIQGFQQPFLMASIEETIKDEGVIAYPNPFNTDLNIKFESLKPEQLIIDVYDVNGKFIISFKPENTEKTITLPLETLMSAEYLIRLRAKNLEYSTKVIKK